MTGFFDALERVVRNAPYPRRMKPPAGMCIHTAPRIQDGWVVWVAHVHDSEGTAESLGLSPERALMGAVLTWCRATKPPRTHAKTFERLERYFATRLTN